MRYRGIECKEWLVEGIFGRENGVGLRIRVSRRAKSPPVEHEIPAAGETGGSR